MDPRIEADVALRKVLKRMVLGIRNVSRNLLLTNVTSQERKSKWANVTFYASQTIKAPPRKKLRM